MSCVKKIDRLYNYVVCRTWFISDCVLVEGKALGRREEIYRRGDSRREIGREVQCNRFRQKDTIPAKNPYHFV